MFSQYDAFENVTIDCSECQKQCPLLYLTPLPSGGFVCRSCLDTMPQDRFAAAFPAPSSSPRKDTA